MLEKKITQSSTGKWKYKVSWTYWQNDTKPEQTQQKEPKGIIDELWTGITEGASDVYDNTVVQILGDEPKQEDKEENHNDKNNEEEKKQKRIDT